MDDLFRCMAIRPAQTADLGATVNLIGPTTPDKPSAFQAALAGARQGDNPFPALAAVSKLYQATPSTPAAPGFANPLSSCTFATQLQALANEVAALPACARTPPSDPEPPAPPKPGRASQARAQAAAPAAAAPPDTLTTLSNLIQRIFGQSAKALVANAGFTTDWIRIVDSIIALFITPAAGRDLLGPLALLARMIDLINRVQAGDATLNAPGVLSAALTRTLLLPQALFPLKPGLVKPVGIADLQVVRQRLMRYELSDVASIENVLKGETKKHSTKHTLTTEHELTTETEKTTVTEEETQTDDRFDLKTESSRVIKEDLSVKSGVSLSVNFGDSFSIKTSTDVAYSKAQSDSIKASTAYAKDVTARAATKITQRVFSKETKKVTEIFEESDDRTFTAPGQNNVGIYQFVNKVYQAQVFNYGKRLLFDISIPEPAAFLLDAMKAPPLDAQPLVEPPLFTLGPHDLSDVDTAPGYYQALLARYQVAGFTTPPPPESVTVAKSYSRKAENQDVIVDGGMLPIPAGYRVLQITVDGGYNYKDENDNETIVTVGPYAFASVKQYGFSLFGKAEAPRLDPRDPVGFRIIPKHKKDDYPFQPNPFDQQILSVPVAPSYREVTSLPWSVLSRKSRDVAVVIEVRCERRQEHFDDWKLKAHAAILDGYNKLLRDYEDQLQRQRFVARPAELGGNPDLNRQIERTELKKAAVQIISGRDLVASPFNAVLPGAANIQPDLSRAYPRADLATAEQQGSVIRFFEQAFEWEQMTYLFYPYHWGRPGTWYDKASLTDSDPLFADFLRAGEARAVIPVRPGFEADVRYYLLTSQIWGGGDMPEIGDADYLPIVEEIKSAAGAPGQEKPQGDPWEIRLPTQLIRIRNDASLPAWTRSSAGPWAWTGA